jgi:hypothetical protein
VTYGLEIKGKSACIHGDTKDSHRCHIDQSSFLPDDKGLHNFKYKDSYRLSKDVYREGSLVIIELKAQYLRYVRVQTVVLETPCESHEVSQPTVISDGYVAQGYCCLDSDDYYVGDGCLHIAESVDHLPNVKTTHDLTNTQGSHAE